MGTLSPSVDATGMEHQLQRRWASSTGCPWVGPPSLASVSPSSGLVSLKARHSVAWCFLRACGSHSSCPSMQARPPAQPALITRSYLSCLHRYSLPLG
jgi:hypothetical protein